MHIRLAIIIISLSGLVAACDPILSELPEDTKFDGPPSMQPNAKNSFRFLTPAGWIGADIGIPNSNLERAIHIIIDHRKKSLFRLPQPTDKRGMHDGY